MRHSLKLNYRFAEHVYNGDKRFEIRNNDRAFQKGDEVKFTVIDDDNGDKDWIYDGNSRPKNCPLVEIKVESEE